MPNYVEPFAGSLAVMLARPHTPKVETVNDLDCYLANFWRAVQADPEGVAKWADWPVSEVDQNARHLWLMQQVEFREAMQCDPDFFDVKIAGWWVWGQNIWIGTGWCSERFYQGDEAQVSRQLPHLGNAGRGIHRQLPHLGDGGTGIHRKLPDLWGRGVHKQDAKIHYWMTSLQSRLRKVRICCGAWDRVLSPSATWKHGLTGILLDPPYATANDGEYATNTDVAHEVAAWAFANGNNPDLRIALCGYVGEHTPPDGWREVAWKARKGYQKTDADGKHSGHKETIWFSPHCLTTQGDLFKEATCSF